MKIEPATNPFRDSGASAGADMALGFQDELGPMSVEAAHGVIEALACAIALWTSPEEAVSRLYAIAQSVRDGHEKHVATLN